MEPNLFKIIVTDGFCNEKDNLFCFKEMFLSDENTGNCYKVISDYYIVAQTENDDYKQPVVTKILHSYRTEEKAIEAHPELAYLES